MSHKPTPACCQVKHFLPPEGDPAFKPDIRQCQQYNRILMRSIIDYKMKRNKTFFEMKVLPDETQKHPWVTRKEASPARAFSGVFEGRNVRQGH